MDPRTASEVNNFLRIGLVQYYNSSMASGTLLPLKHIWNTRVWIGAYKVHNDQSEWKWVTGNQFFV